jgi:dUTP pyrophosphatase
MKYCCERCGKQMEDWMAGAGMTTIEYLRGSTRFKIALCEECYEAFIDFLRDEQFERSRAIKVKLDAGAKMPTKAHAYDAGYDLYAQNAAVIMPGEAVWFDTGVHVSLPAGTTGFLKSKSGLNVKHGITSEGVIDAGYTGSIIVKLYNHGHEPYRVYPGDKITQLVIIKLADVSALEPVDKLGETERGNRGFGSTGR